MKSKSNAKNFHASNSPRLHESKGKKNFALEIVEVLLEILINELICDKDSEIVTKKQYSKA